ncbi:MAG: addiction module protein [Gammaproteobacteria bacterium]
MALSVHEIEKEIHALSTEDKTTLLRALIADLDDEVDENIEQLWLEEAQRRYRELEEGLVKAVPAEEVFRRARAKLKK